jgi:hypothetical protein
MQDQPVRAIALHARLLQELSGCIQDMEALFRLEQGLKTICALAAVCCHAPATTTAALPHCLGWDFTVRLGATVPTQQQTAQHSSSR